MKESITTVQTGSANLLRSGRLETISGLIFKFQAASYYSTFSGWVKLMLCNLCIALYFGIKIDPVIGQIAAFYVFMLCLVIALLGPKQSEVYCKLIDEIDKYDATDKDALKKMKEELLGTPSDEVKLMAWLDAEKAALRNTTDR